MIVDKTESNFSIKYVKISNYKQPNLEDFLPKKLLFGKLRMSGLSNKN